MLDNLLALKVLGFVLMEFVHPTARKAMRQIMPVLLVAWKALEFFVAFFWGQVVMLFCWQLMVY